MKLKRLRLQGYKTFASKTEFDFNSGITAVVGPNGSGKSNIADAIRWVLGEQSYSTLRGKRTADMIFSGSQTRARAGMAQAVLTLDNADGWLPIDYAEVEIGRRAYRSGENDYLINGQKVRLRDVQDLLATSGLAERTYTIIGQGLIDQALSLRAEERRALFEEAAGVSHYQARRAETLRRLQETQHNIERVHDILSEIGPRLNKLKRQASRARTYEQVELDLRHLLRIWYGYQWVTRREALQEQRDSANEAEAAWSASRDTIAARQSEAAQTRRQLEHVQSRRRQLSSQREGLRETRESAQRRVAVLRERSTLLTRQIAETEDELRNLENQRKIAQAAVDEAINDVRSAREELATHEYRLEKFNTTFEVRQQEIDRWVEKASSLEEEYASAQKQLAQTEGMLGELQERLEQHTDNTNGEGELHDLEVEARELSAALASAQELLNRRRAERQEVRNQLESARKEQQSELKNQKKLNDTLAALKEKIARLESRKDLLDQLRDQTGELPDEVQSAGRIASHLDFPTDHRIALEAALGARLNTFLIENEGSVQRFIEAYKGRQSLLAVATGALVVPALDAAPPDDPEVIAWAGDVVSADEKFRPLVDLLFQHILLVTSRDGAYRLGRHLPSGAVAVAPDGFMVHAGGLIEVVAADAHQSIMARERAWREARRELDEARERANELRQEIATQQNTVENQEKMLANLNRNEQQIAKQVYEAEQGLNHHQRNFDRTRQRQTFLSQQRDERHGERQRLKERIGKVSSGVEEKRDQVVQLQSAVSEARMRLEMLPTAEAKEQRRSRRQEIEAAHTILAGRQAVLESRRATLQQVDAQLRRLRDRLERLKHEQDELALSNAREQLEALQDELDAIDRQIEPLNTQQEDLYKKLADIEKALDEEQRKAHDLETLYTREKIALNQRESQLEGLAERIRADLGLVALEFDDEKGGQTPLPMDEIVDRLPDVTELPEDIEKTIRDYRSQLQRIGSVNPDAPREFEETQERHAFLTQQIEDLNQTERRLRRVISELDDLTSRAFAETVRKVDDIFAEFFERLFGGGSAQLVLTEPDDLTISGVDIICRLPNRRQQRLGLLSGGERSLTATALIFALLKVSPPPFCVMDEVDAMLDEANINRFRGVLRDLAEHSQFIVITHNRGTVQAARTVYGISMGTDSASQAISIRPEDYVNGDE